MAKPSWIFFCMNKCTCCNYSITEHTLTSVTLANYYFLKTKKYNKNISAFTTTDYSKHNQLEKDKMRCKSEIQLGTYESDKTKWTNILQN